MKKTAARDAWGEIEPTLRRIVTVDPGRGSVPCGLTCDVPGLCRAPLAGACLSTAIDEDPVQPRQEFEPDALQELAETIAERGVLQPVSVRPAPDEPGRWMLNFGARRLRASRLARKTSIPAFVDDLATSYDQVIENEQREGLTAARACALRRAPHGGRRQPGRDRATARQEPTVRHLWRPLSINAPDWLMTLYRSGRCKSLRALHELRQLQSRRPEAVTRLVSEAEAITRERIAAINAAKQEKNEESRLPLEQGPPGYTSPARSPVRTKGGEPSAQNAVPRNRVEEIQTGGALDGLTPSYALLAELAGDVVEVVVDCAPPEDGHVFVRTNTEDPQQAVPATDLRLIRLVRRNAR